MLLCTGIVFFGLIVCSQCLPSYKETRRCGFVATPRHAIRSSHLRHVNATVTFTCKTGYNLIGSSETTCLMNRTWSTEAPLCSPVPCGVPPEPENSTSYQIYEGIYAPHAERNSFGARRRYDCEEGYNLRGSKILKCGADGKWHGVDPKCERISCPTPQSPQHGMITDIGSAPDYNSTVTFSCSRGYSLSGTVRRTCGKDGSWSGVQPVCMACAKVGDKVWIRRPGGLYQIGTIQGKEGNDVRVHVRTGSPDYEELFVTHIGKGAVHYGLVRDYKPSRVDIFLGATVIVDWSAGVMRMGTVVKILQKSKRTVYKVRLTGSSSKRIFSLDQMRTLQPPIFCDTCPTPEVPHSGYMNPELADYIPGMQVVYSCEYGSELIGARSITCLSSGQWSDNTPACKVFKCDYLDAKAPRNGTVTAEDFTVGGVVEFECDEPFILVGEQKIQCLDNGQWSAKTPVCKALKEVKCERMECKLWEKCTIDQTSQEAQCSCKEAMDCAPVLRPVCGYYRGSLERFNNLCIMKSKACRENTKIDQTECPLVEARHSTLINEKSE